MLFNVEADLGDRIVGYVVSDGYSNSAFLNVREHGCHLATIPCDQERSALVQAGRHATGMCGFCVDECNVSNLKNRSAIELVDAESGLLIYRRRSPNRVLQKRVFRLETHLLPLWRVDDALDPLFQMFQKGIERFGQETSTQILVLNHSTSIYVSGALIYRAYEDHLADQFSCLAILRNPYFELAERLLVLKHMPQARMAEFFGEREQIRLAPAVEFARKIELDERRIRGVFSTMSRAAISCYANPVTRLLAARNVDDLPTKGAVAGALQTLSSFDIVGLREYEPQFLSQVADFLGINEKQIPSTPEFTKTSALAEILQSIPEAEVLVEKDLQVYLHVKSAVESVS